MSCLRPVALLREAVRSGAAVASGIPEDRLYPPESAHLLARVTCSACSHEFPLFSFPLVGSLGGPTGSVSAPVPERAECCPACGATVDDVG